MTRLAFTLVMCVATAAGAVSFGPEQPISAARYGADYSLESPAVAANDKTALIAWPTGEALLIDSAGRQLRSFHLGVNSYTSAAIASDGRDFLLVYATSDGRLADAFLVSATGDVVHVGPISDRDALGTITAAWSGSAYVVSFGTNSGINAVSLSRTGEIVRSEAEIAFNGSAPSIACGVSDCRVVYSMANAIGVAVIDTTGKFIRNASAIEGTGAKIVWDHDHYAIGRGVNGTIAIGTIAPDDTVRDFALISGRHVIDLQTGADTVFAIWDAPGHLNTPINVTAVDRSGAERFRTTLFASGWYTGSAAAAWNGTRLVLIGRGVGLMFTPDGASDGLLPTAPRLPVRRTVWGIASSGGATLTTFGEAESWTDAGAGTLIYSRASARGVLTSPCGLTKEMLLAVCGTVAAGPTTFLVVGIGDNGEMQVERLRRDGALIDTLPLSIGQVQPYSTAAAVWNGTEYVVAWNNATGSTIAGAITEARFGEVGPALQSAVVSKQGMFPVVASNGVTDLIAWHDQNEFGAIKVAVFAPGGTPMFAAIELPNSKTETNIAAASDGSGYAIFSGIPGAPTVPLQHGAMRAWSVDATGKLTRTAEFAAGFPSQALAVWNGVHYVILWLDALDGTTIDLVTHDLIENERTTHAPLSDYYMSMATVARGVVMAAYGSFTRAFGESPGRDHTVRH